jgi:preprotein translocase subunit SecY
MRETIYRVLRTLVQMVAGGGLTVLVDQIVTDVPASYAVYIVIGFGIVVGLCQNLLEEMKAIPALLKSTTSVQADPAKLPPEVDRSTWGINRG